MNLFKYRLKQLGKTVLLYTITIACLALLMWVSTFVPMVVGNIIAYTFIGLSIIGMIWGFIYWLFIEPFKKE